MHCLSAETLALPLSCPCNQSTLGIRALYSGMDWGLDASDSRVEDMLPWCARVREPTALLAPALQEATLASGWRAGLFVLKGYLIQAAWNASAIRRETATIGGSITSDGRHMMPLRLTGNP